jgi:hypothetical protein
VITIEKFTTLEEFSSLLKILAGQVPGVGNQLAKDLVFLVCKLGEYGFAFMELG